MLTSWISKLISQTKRLDPDFYQKKFLDAEEKIRSFKKLTKLESIKLSSVPICRGIDMPVFVPEGSGKKIICLNSFDPPTIKDKNLPNVHIDQHHLFKHSIVNHGDLLVAMGGYVGKAAIVPPYLSGANINRHIAKVVVDSYLADKYFIWAFIESPTGLTLFQRYVTGAVQPGINLEDLRVIPLIAPERYLQNSIGNYVRKAERLCELAEIKKIKLKETFSDLTNLFDDPILEDQISWFLRPNEFSSIRVEAEYYKPKYLAAIQQLLSVGAKPLNSSLLINAKYGLSVEPDYSSSGLLFVRGNDLRDNMIIFENLMRLSDRVSGLSKGHTLTEGDVLLTRSGTVGVAAVADSMINGAAFGSFIIRLRFKSILDPYYVSYFFNSVWGRIQTERERNGAVQENINLEEIGRILIPIPDIDNQKRFGEEIRLLIRYLRESFDFLTKAKNSVESLIDGSLDEEILLAESVEIEKWLKENPSPYGREQ